MPQVRLNGAETQVQTAPAGTSVLGLVLGYEALQESNPSDLRSAPFVASLTHDVENARLKADWALLEASGANSVFQAHSWQRGLIAHRLAATEAAPLFVTIHEPMSGRAVAIFPLQRRRANGIDVIEYLGADFCDTCQPIISADLVLSPDATASFTRALVEAMPPGDVLRLGKMQRNLFGRANPFADLAGTSQSPDQTFPVILAPDQAGYVGSTSAFKSYQKQWRKLDRRDGISFDLFEDRDAIAAAFDAMIAMRSSRFDDLNRDDLLNQPLVAKFYRDMALLPDDERVVRIAGLKVGDTYTAYIYMMDNGTKFSTVISAIDNTVGNAYAPGLILFTKIFEHASQAGYAFGDIGIGYMHYKTRFSTTPNPLFVFERPLSLKGQIYLVALKAFREAKRLAKSNKTVKRLIARFKGSANSTPPTVKSEPAEAD